jgi:holo-[acyl-carrier protein] synthase
VDTERFARVIARTPLLVPRVFTEREIELSGGAALRATSLAARWAAKEAVAKVLVDNRGLEWHDCELVAGALGEPIIEVSGTIAAAAAARGIESWLVSLSHDGHMAIAFVVATRAAGVA